MFGFPRTVRWWNLPERELLRREVAWAWRGLRRPWRLFALTLFLALAFATAFSLCAEISAEDRFARRSAGEIVRTCFFLWAPALALFFLTWLWILYRRALAPFGRDRARDLVMTPLPPNEIWPAVLAAPTVWAMALSATVAAGALAAVCLFAVFHLHDSGELLSGLVPMGFVHGALTIWLGGASLAVSAFTVRRCNADAGWGPMAGWALLGFAGLAAMPFVAVAFAFLAAYGLGIGLSIGLAITFLGGFGAIFPFVGKFARRLRARGIRMLSFVIRRTWRGSVFMVRNVSGWGMYQRNVRVLRSAEAWEKLVAVAARE